jgi:hypothetical protein
MHYVVQLANGGMTPEKLAEQWLKKDFSHQQKNKQLPRQETTPSKLHRDKPRRRLLNRRRKNKSSFNTLMSLRNTPKILRQE